MNKEKIPVTNIISLVALVIALTALSINIYKKFIRTEAVKPATPFTQEALKTYPAEKPTRYFTKKDCEEITGDVCNVTVISTISATSSEVVYWFSPIYPQKTAEKSKKIEWQEYINISKQAQLNYCKKVNGYTYIHSDVCLIDNELKYLNYDFNHSTTTSKGTTVWNSAPSDIMEWEEEDILKYLIEHIKTTDVHWPNDEQKARESYREYVKSINKSIEKNGSEFNYISIEKEPTNENEPVFKPVPTIYESLARGEAYPEYPLEKPVAIYPWRESYYLKLYYFDKLYHIEKGVKDEVKEVLILSENESERLRNVLDMFYE